jgi:lipopolysaccharide transport system ATP-binding protein
MAETVIKIESLSKQYRYGVIGHGTLYKDLQSWWARFRGRGDPNVRITRQVGPVLDDDRFWALEDINLEVQKGEKVGIIGRNGAGKSTLLKILSRVTIPTNGQVMLKGRVASLLEVGTGFHPEQTGRENIFLNGAILGMSKAEIRRKFDEIVDFSGLEKFIDTPVKRYSSGMYVRLAFAVAAHLDSEIMLVDEVLAVGDVQFQKKCLGKMKDVAEGGRTVLFVSHNMAAIRNLCDRALLLDNGRLILDDASDHAIAHYLDQNLIQGAVASEEEINKRIEGQINRQNPFVHIEEIAILGEDGVVRNSFHSDEAIFVSITFKCLQPVQDLVVMVNVVDEDAVPILASQNFDDANISDYFFQLNPGVYNVRCKLPKNTFGEVPLFLSVHIVYPKTEHIVVNKILEFNVRFKGYNDIQWGSCPSIFIRPELKWSFQPGLRQQLINKESQ